MRGDLPEHLLQVAHVGGAKAQQINIRGWALWLLEPQIEQQCPLEQKMLVPRRNTEPVQHPLQAIAGQQPIKILALSPRALHQALADRRRQIFYRFHPNAPSISK